VRARGQRAGRRALCQCVAERATALKARVLHTRAWNAMNQRGVNEGEGGYCDLVETWCQSRWPQSIPTNVGPTPSWAHVAEMCLKFAVGQFSGRVTMTNEHAALPTDVKQVQTRMYLRPIRGRSRWPWVGLLRTPGASLRASLRASPGRQLSVVRLECPNSKGRQQSVAKR